MLVSLLPSSNLCSPASSWGFGKNLWDGDIIPILLTRSWALVSTLISRKRKRDATQMHVNATRPPDGMRLLGSRHGSTLAGSNRSRNWQNVIWNCAGLWSKRLKSTLTNVVSRIAAEEYLSNGIFGLRETKLLLKILRTNLLKQVKIG